MSIWTRLASLLRVRPAEDGRAGASSASGRRKIITQFYETILRRTPDESEVREWTRKLDDGAPLADVWRSIYRSKEGRKQRSPLMGSTVSGFVSDAYSIVLGKGASARDIAEAAKRLAKGRVTPEDLILELYRRRSRAINRRRERAENPKPSAVPILGLDRSLSLEDWNERVALADKAGNSTSMTYSRFPQLAPSDGVRASVIASLYRGGRYIRRYLENITSQTIFDQCELIIVDADSPDNEAAVIAEYASRFPQIVYKRLPYRATIYEAWNIGVRMARGRYLTNANLDDLRRKDSLELQCGVLDNLPFVDVAYQEVLYTLDDSLSIDDIEKIGVTSRLPIITPHTLGSANSPHNGPMWRKSIHADIGFFNQDLRSAGDWEFWIRCLIAGKKFYKLNDPHVVYYANPEGVSTDVNGPGHREGREVSRRYMSRLIPPAAVEDFADFARRCGVEPRRGDATTDRYAFVNALLCETAASSKSDVAAR